MELHLYRFASPEHLPDFTGANVSIISFWFLCMNHRISKIFWFYFMKYTLDVFFCSIHSHLLKQEARFSHGSWFFKFQVGNIQLMGNVKKCHPPNCLMCGFDHCHVSSKKEWFGFGLVKRLLWLLFLLWNLPRALKFMQRYRFEFDDMVHYFSGKCAATTEYCTFLIV